MQRIMYLVCGIWGHLALSAPLAFTAQAAPEPAVEMIAPCDEAAIEPCDEAPERLCDP